MKVLIILGLVAAVSAVSFVDVSKEEWNNFKVRIFFDLVIPEKLFIPGTKPFPTYLAVFLLQIRVYSWKSLQTTCL